MENPFHYGEIVGGSAFTDRDEEIEEVLGDVRNGQNVVLISPRRYGKTSLLFEVTERAKRHGTLIAYIDLFRTPSKDTFADHLADAIYGGLVAPIDRALHRASTVFQKLPLQPKVTINPDGTPTFEFSPGAAERDVDRTIEQLLTLPGDIARERKRRVVLILDEFQEVVTLDPHLPALMRSVFQLQSEVSHIFAGSRRHLMNRVFTDENQPMYRLAKPLVLRTIPREAFAPFIEERFSSTQQAIEPNATKRILDVTEGHPHDTQELCYFVWELALARQAVVTSDLVESALNRVIDHEEARFTTLWEGLTPYRRLVLSVLARADQRGIYAEEYRRQRGLGPASSLQKAIAYFIDRELVEFSTDGTYRVPDVFLRIWASRPLTPPSSER
jgi:AAA+ ATPase superfamily predicted ATPase